MTEAGRTPVLARTRARVERARALVLAGYTYAAAARRLGVTPWAVCNWARRYGLPPSPHDPTSEAFREIAARTTRGAMIRRECESVAEYRRLRRLRQYQAAGYPVGVTTEAQQRVFDAARRAGGVTLAGCVPGVVAWKSTARKALFHLVAIGAVVRVPAAACYVEARRCGRGQPVPVYRVAVRFEDTPAGRAG